jgi:two-component system nitrate/nitrite response regulator NarL
MDQLTPREYEVVTLVLSGLSNREVARELGVSDGTVKLHMHHIMQKLGFKSRYAVMASRSSGRPSSSK